MFIHFLITRFNIKISGFGPERMTSPFMTEEWLTQRLDLFLTYCVPSVLEQTNKNFTWLVYFDRSTPGFILEKVSFLKNKSPDVRIILVDDYDEMLLDIRAKIKSSQKPFVITSRLDNDDIISNEYIERIQHNFSPVHNTIFNFKSGLEFSIRKNVMKKWNNRPHNQFISLVEDVGRLSTGSIYSFAHWKAPLIGHIINIEGEPFWIYIGHENNYSEQKVRALPVFTPKNLTMFPKIIRQAKLSWINTLIYTIKWIPDIMYSKSRRLLSRIK
ncbi:MAG TPA: glycosyltransferase [Saprospiraceae bacterium]|nr:glycosyltransferase [Saprospiraceae bacterium]